MTNVPRCPKCGETSLCWCDCDVDFRDIPLGPMSEEAKEILGVHDSKEKETI